MGATPLSLSATDASVVMLLAMDLSLTDEQQELVATFSSLLFSLGTTVYVGTSQIQRNIIPERACHLPR